VSREGVVSTAPQPRAARPASRPGGPVLVEVVVVATRFDPFRDLDRLAERLISQAGDAQQAMRALPVDLFRAGDHYALLCDLPGVDPGSVEVGIDGRTLTIRAQRTPRSEDVEWLTQERPTGTFVRQLTLGPAVDLEHIDASYNDGVLSLTLPVVEAAKPRMIPVSTGAHDRGRDQASITQ
jgi:HSP20 family protein